MTLPTLVPVQGVLITSPLSSGVHWIPPFSFTVVPITYSSWKCQSRFSRDTWRCSFGFWSLVLKSAPVVSWWGLSQLVPDTKGSPVVRSNLVWPGWVERCRFWQRLGLTCLSTCQKTGGFRVSMCTSRPPLIFSDSQRGFLSFTRCDLIYLHDK